MNDNQVKSVCMDAAEIERSLTRIAHQILEANHGAENLALVGIVTRGDILARMLVERIAGIEGCKVPLGSLDISFYRDDFLTHLSPELHGTDIAFDIRGKKIVLVDDVLYTGRTIRAALEALMDLGRPSEVQLAVLVDRGHRELPIKPDYVGKNVPSSKDENVRLFLEEVDGCSRVEILNMPPGTRVGSAPLGSGQPGIVPLGSGPLGSGQPGSASLGSAPASTGGE
jgi:pyrimidine operon attenuation protein/uracil phosphoribosyltransferase